MTELMKENKLAKAIDDMCNAFEQSQQEIGRLERENTQLKDQLRWRPVSEKPEKEGFYLAKQDTTDEPFVLSYKDNVWQFFDYDIGEMVITSQPVSWLPIPPQGE